MRSDIRIKRVSTASGRRKPPPPQQVADLARREPPPVSFDPTPPAPAPPAPPSGGWVGGEVFIKQSDWPAGRRLPVRWRSLTRRAAWTAAAVLVVAGLGVRAQEEGRSVQSEVTASVGTARAALAGARSSLAAADYAAARQQFSVAESALHQANQTLAERGQFGGLLSGQGNGSLSAGTQMLATGELLADSGVALSEDLQRVQEELAATGNDFYKLGEILVARLPSIQANLAETDRRLGLLSYTVASAKRAAPSGEIGAAVTQFDEALPEMKRGTDQARTVTDQLPALLGQDRFKQYLIWFQNPAELRATGGFIGTYGRIHLDDGAMKELVIDSIYNPANQANQGSQEPAPKPYGRFYGDTQEPVWGMQDANWSPDFPTSARKFQSFYEKSGGPTTDGVIALTTTPVIEMLRLVGPIEMPEYSYTLTADNFQQLIQADQLGRSAAGDQDPKRILRDFAPKLLAKVGAAPPKEQQAAYRIIATAATKRDLQVYFNDSALEQTTKTLAVDGRLDTGPTGLAVIDTNIAGRKSSADVTTTAKLVVTIGKDGRTGVELSLVRRHSGASSADANTNYTRLYLPAGSQVRETAGYADYAPVEVFEEDGFTVVGGWTDIAPGAERTVTVRYALPQKVSLERGVFPLVFVRQPGSAVTLAAEVRVPAGFAWADGTRSLAVNQPVEQTVRQPLNFQRVD